MNDKTLEGQILSLHALQDLIDGLQDLVYKTDPDRRIRYLNKAFLSIFNCPSKDKLLGKPISDLYVVGDHRDLFEECMRDRGGRVINYFVYVKRFSSQEHFYLSVDSNWIGGIEPNGIEGTGRDLTGLVNFLGAFFQINPKGVLTFCSQSFADLFGYRGPQQLIGTNIQDLFFPDIQFVEVCKNQLNGSDGQRRLQGLRTKDDGSHETISIKISVSAIRQNVNGSIREVGYQGILEDVTDADRTRLKLEEEYSIHDLLMSQSQDGIYLIQGDQLKYVNEAFCSIVGRDKDVLKNMPYLELIHQDDRARVRVEVQSKLAGEEREPYECRIITGNGNERTVKIKSGHCKIGNVDSIYGYLRDITLDLLHQEELKRKVYESTLSLKEALEDKEILLDTVVHEIEGPVVAIRGLTERLILGIPKDTMALHRQLEKLAHIDELCELIFMLEKNVSIAQSNDVLGTREIKSCHIEKELVVRAQNYMKPLLRNKDLPLNRFSTHLSGAPPFANVNPDHFLQVFFNLFSNAIKYAEENPNLFEVEINSQYASAKGLTLNISDMGIGIPLGESTIIFEKRKSGSNTRNMPGMGLGLWVSQRILEAYGCSIWVHNRCKPTTFAIRIPNKLLTERISTR